MAAKATFALKLAVWTFRVLPILDSPPFWTSVFYLNLWSSFRGPLYLENDSKEKIDTQTFTIEHVMPRNEDLSVEWQTMLGANWKSVQEAWLNRLGNITLTAYNSEYSDLPFDKKKSLVDKKGRQVGFEFSPLRLNKFIREQALWTAAEIEIRGKELAARALRIWPPLVVDAEVVKEAELAERKAHAAKYSVDNLEFDEISKLLFAVLRAKILALGDDVVELCGAMTVTYRVYDFFVEVIPRKERLSLVLNLDYSECDDPTQSAADATEYAFIVHASESGGVVFSVKDASDIAPAMHIVRQAYERVSE